MTFIHGYLLGGLLLAGVPVLLHLLMRQKPKRLTFPAFRFLKARQRTNQRKLRLQHLLLLLLRIAVIVALCLALARPRVFSERTGAASDRPVAAILLFDTSPSMEYGVSGVSRLEESVQRARELLGEMDAGSRVAVLDSGDDNLDVLLPVAEAKSRLDNLRIRPGAGALNRSVQKALALLGQESGGEDAPPRFLYVFSDRTRASWDSNGVKPALPEGVQVIYVDVGVEKPRDLAIEKVEVVPRVVPPGALYEVRVSIRGTPGGHKNEVSCRIDSDTDAPDRKPVELEKEETGAVIVFSERKAPRPAADGPIDVPYQITVSLGTRDALPFNNTRHATLLVRGGRKMLTIVENEDRLGLYSYDKKQDREFGTVWQTAQVSLGSFDSTTKTVEQVDKLSEKDLSNYSIIALVQTPAVPEPLARKLTAYVRNGGKLAIVPAGDELLTNKDEFNNRLKDLLPAPLATLASTAGKPLLWEPFSGAHPLMKPFVAWTRQVDPDFAREELRPAVRRYWQLGKWNPEGRSITPYANPEKSPALAERDPKPGRGKVVLFTTPLDFRLLDPKSIYSPRWTNYLPPYSSFGLILIDQVGLYLAGETVTPELNFRCGQVPQVFVPSPLAPPYTLDHPSLSGSERNLKAPDPGSPLLAPQAAAPGNYLILDGKKNPVAGFSLDVPSQESDLDRIAVEELESVLGEKSVLPVGQSVSLRDAMSTSRPPPVELLPYLMIALLVVLTLESLLANRFYRRTPQPEQAALPSAPPVLTKEAS
jgi:hypothetical protein